MARPVLAALAFALWPSFVASDPVCPASNFISGVPGLSVACRYAEEYGRWVMQINSSGIPPHKYINPPTPSGGVLAQNFSVDIPLPGTVTANKSRAALPQDPCNFQGTFQTGSVPEKPQNRYFFPIVGFALNGVAFMSPLAAPVHVDPLFPGKTSTGEPGSAEKLDGCIGHPQGLGIYHYHMMPPCLFGNDTNGAIPLPDAGDPRQLGLDGFRKKLTLIGYAMDGNPVYGPYDDSGNLHTGLDVCNGKFDDDGKYAYYSTTTFPYHIGCFGPGPMTSQQGFYCSTNGRNSTI